MEQSMHMKLYRAFHAQRTQMRAGLAELGLGVGQPKLLAYLTREGPCRQRQLAEYFEVDPAAVSRMLEALQRGGFVERRPDDRDRRGGLIELTDTGRAAGLAWQRRRREVEERMLEGFTPEEREQFAGYLNRAYRNLRDGKEGPA